MHDDRDRLLLQQSHPVPAARELRPSAPAMDQDGVERRAVTAWCIERINEFDYDVHYKPGKYNDTADALSRYPMIGPKTLSRIGVGAALSRLLESMPEAARNHGALWFWAAKDTDELKKELRPWSKYCDGPTF